MLMIKFVPHVRGIQIVIEETPDDITAGATTTTVPNDVR